MSVDFFSALIMVDFEQLFAHWEMLEKHTFCYECFTLEEWVYL